MVVLAIVLAAASRPEQVLAGSAFEAFAVRSERLCPARRLRGITPGDLDWFQDSFEDQLSTSRRRSLAHANTGTKRCEGGNGLACPSTETLAAMRRTNLLPRFVAWACTHHAP